MNDPHRLICNIRRSLGGNVTTKWLRIIDKGNSTNKRDWKGAR